MPDARKTFGKPPRDCPICGGKGMVLDTRVRIDSISRRHACGAGHRWTSSEILVIGSKIGYRNINTVNTHLKNTLIDHLISELEAIRKSAAPRRSGSKGCSRSG